MSQRSAGIVAAQTAGSGTSTAKLAEAQALMFPLLILKSLTGPATRRGKHVGLNFHIGRDLPGIDTFAGRSNPQAQLSLLPRTVKAERAWKPGLKRRPGNWMRW